MSDGLERMTAEAESDEDIDGVVASLISSRHDMTALGRKVPGFDPDDLT